MTSSARWFLLFLVAFLSARKSFSSTCARSSILALLLGVLSLLAAAPAQAQTTVWSATLTPRDVALTSQYGCSRILAADACSVSSTLTDDDFSHEGTDYQVIRLIRLVNSFILELDRAIPQSLRGATLNVGSTALSLADATITNTDKTASWTTGLPTLAQGVAVSVSLVEPPTPTGYSVTLMADNLRPIEGLTVTLTATLDNPAPAGGATFYFINAGGSAAGNDFTWSMPDRRHCQRGRQCNPTRTQPIRINQGQTTVTTTLMVIDDAEGENDETIMIEVRSSLALTSHPRLTLTIPANTGRTDNTPTDDTPTDTGGPPPGGGGPSPPTGGGEPPPDSDGETPPEDEEPSASCQQEDRDILRSFYEMTDGENWDESEDWNSDEPLGEWHGVDTEDGSVVSLLLSENGLSGEMPTEELLCLKEQLVELALWGNDDLTGDVPEELVLAVERAALREIAETLEINPEWFENYGDPYDFEDWYEGVTTDDGRVTGLDFRDREEIERTIPAVLLEQLGRLGTIYLNCTVSVEGDAPGRVNLEEVCEEPEESEEETVSSGGGGCAVGASQGRVGASGLLVAILVLLAFSRGLRARSY